MERGITSGPEAEATVRNSLGPLLSAGADTIVLGCTHYPFLSDTISTVAGNLYPHRQVTIIDPAPAVARHLVEVMQQEGISLTSPEGSGIELHSSGSPDILTTFFQKIS